MCYSLGNIFQQNLACALRHNLQQQKRVRLVHKHRAVDADNLKVQFLSTCSRKDYKNIITKNKDL